MKTLIWILATTLALGPAAKAETLNFAASIQDEDLAEEAILLLHCLAERTGAPWEFTGKAGGNHYLELKEKGQAASGKYRNGEKELQVDLEVGGAEAVCAKLLPEGKGAETLDLKPAQKTDFSDFSAPPAKSNYWPWAVGAALAVGAGFLLFHSGKENHSGFTMN